MMFSTFESQVMLIGLTAVVMIASIIEAEHYRQCAIECEKELTLYKIASQRDVMRLQQQLREVAGHEIH